MTKDEVTKELVELYQIAKEQKDVGMALNVLLLIKEEGNTLKG